MQTSVVNISVFFRSLQGSRVSFGPDLGVEVLIDME